jgi:hypothetical protein
MSDWHGVTWYSIRDGRCTEHDEPVGPITGLCLSCHREQLEAARNGDRSWERPAWAPPTYRPLGKHAKDDS